MLTHNARNDIHAMIAELRDRYTREAIAYGFGSREMDDELAELGRMMLPTAPRHIQVFSAYEVLTASSKLSEEFAGLVNGKG